MKKTTAKILGCTVLLHLFSLGALGAERVAEVVVRGNEHVSIEKIRRVLQIREGDPYDEEKFKEALRRLFQTKEFADIRAFKERVGDAVKLEIVLREYLRIDEVRFEGNEHIKEEDLSDAVSTRKGSFARPSLIRKDIEAIADLYQEKGYYRVAVHDTIEKEGREGKTTLVYRIKEGSKVSIKHIDIFGNRSLDSEQIRKAMKSKEDRWWRGGKFNPQVLEEDEERILDLYRDHGFLDAALRDKELVFSEDGKDLDIFITVEEGIQYKVGRLKWSGNTVIEDKEISPSITLAEGDVFNESLFKEIQLAISSLYWDRGFIYSSVTPIKKKRGDVIDVELEIVEGKPAHIREISIAGNTKTSEEVIRRELVISPGEVFLRPRLLRSLREIFYLGFFSGPPEVSTSPANEEGDIDLTIKVKEKQTGQFRMGAGFSALNSISGFLGFTETNFLGKGQRLGIDWEFSRYRQNIDLRFTEPWLMGTPTELSVGIYNMVQNQIRQQFYDDRRKGISLQVGRPFPWFDYTSVYWRYRYESVELTNFASGYRGPLLGFKWPQRTSSTAFTVARNSTDSPFHPTTGTASRFTVELNGGTLLGGDVKFQRYESSFSWYESLFWKFALQLKYEVGVLDGYQSPSQVPDYELFRLGGNRRYALRGYDFFEVVPGGNPDFIGGRFMQILSYEVSFPISSAVYGLFFFDSGNTWNSFREADLFDLKKGIGFGIRIELPMLGTVGFDYGYGFDKRGGPGWEPHISLGGSF